MRHLSTRPSETVHTSGCICYVLFIILCGTFTVAITEPRNTYLNGHAVLEALSNGEFVESIDAGGYTHAATFFDIEAAPDIWLWLSQALVPGVFVDSWYGDDSTPSFVGNGESGYMNDYHRLLGGVLIQQIRSEAHDCKDIHSTFSAGGGHLSSFYPTCYTDLDPMDSTRSGSRQQYVLNATFGPNRPLVADYMRLHAMWAPQPYAIFATEHKSRCIEDGWTDTLDGEVNLAVDGLFKKQGMCESAAPPAGHPYWDFLEDYGNRTSVLTDKKQLGGCFKLKSIRENPEFDFWNADGDGISKAGDESQCCYAGQLEFTFTSSGQNKNQFAALMRAGISHDTASAYIGWLKKAVWIDKQSRQVTITVPLFNGNHGRINVARFKLFLDTAGGMRKEVSYVSVPLFGNTLPMQLLAYFYLCMGTLYIFLQLRAEYKSMHGCCDMIGRCLCCIVCCGRVCCTKKSEGAENLIEALSHRSPRSAQDRALVRPTEPGALSQEEVEANEALMDDVNGVSHLGELAWDETLWGADITSDGFCAGCASRCSNCFYGIRGLLGIMFRRSSSLYYCVFCANVYFFFHNDWCQAELRSALQNGPQERDTTQTLHLLTQIETTRSWYNYLSMCQTFFFLMTAFRLHIYAELYRTPNLVCSSRDSSKFALAMLKSPPSLRFVFDMRCRSSML